MKPWIEEALHIAESGRVLDAFSAVHDAMQSDPGPYTPGEISAIAKIFLVADQPGLSRMLLERLPRDQWTDEHHSLYDASGETEAPPAKETPPAEKGLPGARPVAATGRIPGAPLRIAMISASDSGGAGTAAWRLHRGLLGHGVESRMYVMDKRRDDENVLVLPPAPKGDSVVDALPSDPQRYLWRATTARWEQTMAAHPDRPGGLEAFTDPLSYSRVDLVRGIREADVVSFHWIAGVVDYPTLHNVLAGKPSVWTLHDLNAFTGGCHYAAGCEKFRDRCGSCPQLGSSDENDFSRRSWDTKKELYDKISLTVVTPSDWLRREAESSSLFRPFPVHVIPNPHPLDLFHPRDREAERQRIGVEREERMVLFGADSVGNHRKGFLHLTEALSELDRKLDARQRLALVTFGRKVPEISLPERFRIVHLGSLADEETIAGVYSAADLFVLPSLEDNLPNTVAESLACGTPVVSFSIGGIPEMVDHLKTGYLAKPFDIADLAEGIQWVLAQLPEQSDEIRTECRDVAVKKYSQATQAGLYLELFRSLLSEA